MSDLRCSGVSFVVSGGLVRRTSERQRPRAAPASGPVLLAGLPGDATARDAEHGQNEHSVSCAPTDGYLMTSFRNERDTMACTCIDLTNQSLREKNAELDCWMFFDGRPSRVIIPTSLIEKRRGQKYPKMIPDYCPFCGKRYEDEVISE